VTSDADVVTLLLIATDGQSVEPLWPSVAKAARDADGTVILQRWRDGPDRGLVGIEFPLAIDATRAALQLVRPASAARGQAMLCTRRRPVDDLELGRTAELLRHVPAGHVVVSASTAVLVDLALPSQIELVPFRSSMPGRPRSLPERLYVLQRVDGNGAALTARLPGRARRFQSDLIWARRAAPIALIGRDDATARLCAAWRATLAGRRRTVAITGERGIGKTALVADLALAAHDSGALVLYGRSEHEPESVDRPIRRAVGFTLGDHGFDQLRARLDALADDGPVLLVLDDVSWGSPLERLAGEIAVPSHGAPWMLAVTVRAGWARQGKPWPQAFHLADAAEAAHLDHVALGGLDASHVVELVHQSLDRRLAPDDAAIGWLSSATAGNPLLIRTILSSIQCPSAAPEELLAMRRHPPERVAEVVRWRLAALPARTQQALACAARCHRAAVEVDSIADALPAAPVTVHAALEPAMQDDLVHVDPAGERYHFRHDIVRRVLGDGAARPGPQLAASIGRPRASTAAPPRSGRY
jgi:hypothetical protein